MPSSGIHRLQMSLTNQGNKCPQELFGYLIHSSWIRCPIFYARSVLKFGFLSHLYEFLFQNKTVISKNAIILDNHLSVLDVFRIRIAIFVGWGSENTFISCPLRKPWINQRNSIPFVIFAPEVIVSVVSTIPTFPLVCFFKYILFIYPSRTTFNIASVCNNTESYETL